jgi:hypothetical protein
MWNFTPPSGNRAPLLSATWSRDPQAGQLPGCSAGTRLETFDLAPDGPRLLFQRRTLFLDRSDPPFDVLCRRDEQVVRGIDMSLRFGELKPNRLEYVGCAGGRGPM